jgi:ATP-dependent DNA helicase PIF1
MSASNYSLVLGSAGTGKTTLVRGWAEGDPSAVLCATTGIAAINLGGTTINSLLGYFDTESLQARYDSGGLVARLQRNRDAGVSWYVLDEVSMLSADQLSLLVNAIDMANMPSLMRVHSGRQAPKPIRLTLVGDFCQLAPIKERYACEAPEWSEFTDQTMLSTIQRQTDVAFVEALQAVRRGDAKAALPYFEPLFNEAIFTGFQGTTLKARNEDVDTYNETRLEHLPGKACVFIKHETGQASGEWKHIPKHLHLKIGALVVILANKRYPPSTDFEYVNGDLGTLVEATPNTAFVHLMRTNEVVQVEPVTRDHARPIDPEHAAALQRKGEGHRVKGRNEVLGSVMYAPLRAAYASTIHKSQGLSLDSVQIDIRNHFFKHPAMLYVALSRARSPQGLRLVGSPRHFLTRCVVDPRVRQWL